MSFKKDFSSVFKSPNTANANLYSFLAKNEYDISSLAQRIRANYGAFSNTMSLKSVKNLAI